MRIAAFLLLSLTAAPAMAVSLQIANLDGKPHRIGVRSIGDESHVVTVAPKSTAYIHDHDPWILNLDDPESKPIRAQDYEEYVIWPNGRLELQRYQRFGLPGR